MTIKDGCTVRNKIKGKTTANAVTLHHATIAIQRTKCNIRQRTGASQVNRDKWSVKLMSGNKRMMNG